MAISSGTVRLFSVAAIAMAAAGSIAYGLKHKDDLAGVAKFAESVVGGQSLADAADEKQARKEQNENSYDVTLDADAQGHFLTEVEVNGRSIDVIVDTGATLVALTHEDAESAGIYLKESDYTGRAATANGESKVAPVNIAKVSIGGITVRNVRAAVAEPGKLHKTLLGMSFLGRLSRVDMRGKELVLSE